LRGTNGKVYEVDSANLLVGLAERKPKDWPEYLNRVSGSMAIAVGVETGKRRYVVLARNSGNPLYVARAAKLGGAVVYASTKEILERAANTVGVELKSTQQVVAGTMLIISPAGGGSLKIKEKRWESFRTNTNSAWESYGYQNRHTTGSTQASTTQTDLLASAKASDAVIRRHMCSRCGNWNLEEEMFPTPGNGNGKRCVSCTRAWLNDGGILTSGHMLKLRALEGGEDSDDADVPEDSGDYDDYEQCGACGDYFPPTSIVSIIDGGLNSRRCVDCIDIKDADYSLTSPQTSPQTVEDEPEPGQGDTE
jgi:hypothetical protein